MGRLHELEPIVQDTLIKFEETRKDDFVLLAHIYNILCPEIMNMSFNSVLKNHKVFKLPSFESISRCRRKVQEKNPELRNANAVEIRVEQQKEYIEYALNN